MVLIYSPDCTKMYGATGGEFEGAASVYRRGVWKLLTSCSQDGTSYSLVQTLVTITYTASQTDGQTDRRQYHVSSDHMPTACGTIG